MYWRAMQARPGLSKRDDDELCAVLLLLIIATSSSAGLSVTFPVGFCWGRILVLVKDCNQINKIKQVYMQLLVNERTPPFEGVNG